VRLVGYLKRNKDNSWFCYNWTVFNESVSNWG